MDILSVKNFKGITKIKYRESASEDSEGDAVISVLVSEEPPAPAFFETLANVSGVFMKNAMLKPTNDCKFVQCVFGYSEDHTVMDCVCRVMEKQQGGIKYNIMFDAIPGIRVSGKESTPDEKKFQDLIKEAKAFINGERAEKKLL